MILAVSDYRDDPIYDNIVAGLVQMTLILAKGHSPASVALTTPVGTPEQTFASPSMPLSIEEESPSSSITSKFETALNHPLVTQWKFLPPRYKCYYATVPPRVLFARFRHAVTISVCSVWEVHQPRYAVPYVCKLFPCVAAELAMLRPKSWDELEDALLQHLIDEYQCYASETEVNRLLAADIEVCVPVISAEAFEHAVSVVASAFNTQHADRVDICPRSALIKQYDELFPRPVVTNVRVPPVSPFKDNSRLVAFLNKTVKSIRPHQDPGRHWDNKSNKKDSKSSRKSSNKSGNKSSNKSSNKSNEMTNNKTDNSEDTATHHNTESQDNSKHVLTERELMALVRPKTSCLIDPCVSDLPSFF
ncbi:hypothetical protein CJU90_3183 [Yarrowia sp. C11]|nr:hypothetical protein CKK34_4631 [Yarrowia sp. E02]KAG5369688.1 hypothetical protein CJU90_3183 [Yarrowia sp. C11]